MTDTDDKSHSQKFKYTKWREEKEMKKLKILIGIAVAISSVVYTVFRAQCVLSPIESVTLGFIPPLGVLFGALLVAKAT